MKGRIAALLSFLVVVALSPGFAGQNDEFWDAAREGKLETVKKLHADGIDVDAKTKYGATALSFAADRGHLEVVKFLVAQGADVNVKDTFYEFTPIGWALFNDHFDIVLLLLKAGSNDGNRVLTTGVRQKNAELVNAALATEQIDGDDVARALGLAKQVEGAEEIVTLLENADVKPVERVEVEVDPQVLQGFVGKYKNGEIDMTIDVTFNEGVLTAQASGQSALTLRPTGERSFETVEVAGIKVSFAGRGGIVERLVVEQGSSTMNFMPVSPEAEAEVDEPVAAAPPEAKPRLPSHPPAIVRSAAQNWPSFRGPQASGIADGQGAPLEWDAASGKNIKWKTEIPGIGNASPVIWGDRVFVITAISGAGDDTFRTGLYGDVDSVEDESEHTWNVYALDRQSGKIIWEKTAARRVPGAKRHLKSSQANSTPVTDGKHLVVLLGAVGTLLCYDLDGKLLWETDTGILDSGWFYDKSYQWGHAASPVIYKNTVIVLANLYQDSFVAAYKLSNGKQVWRTARDEVPQWGSPTVYRGGKRDELITNGTTIRGYDPATGKQLWSLGPNSEVTVATPVVYDDRFYVTAGYPPVRPIYVIRPGGSGDISLAEDEESNGSIQWSKNRGGTYIPTPVAYRGHLYTCANNGRLTAYDAASGERVYQERIGGGGGSFSASPIAGDGRLYFTSETGEIYVVKAGPEYEELATNEMGEVCMSTPAISDGLMVVRTSNHVFGIAEPKSMPVGSAN